jgi:hypothetical protein
MPRSRTRAWQRQPRSKYPPVDPFGTAGFTHQLRGSGLIRIPYQYAEQGGQGPYDPVGFSRRSLANGRRGYTGHDPVHPVFKFGQDSAPTTNGPSVMSLGIAGALGWLVGRL